MLGRPPRPPSKLPQADMMGTGLWGVDSGVLSRQMTVVLSHPDLQELGLMQLEKESGFRFSQKTVRLGL